MILIKQKKRELFNMTMDNNSNVEDLKLNFEDFKSLIE